MFAFVILMTNAHAASLRFLAWDHDVSAKKVSVKNGDNVQAIVDLHPDKRSQSIKGVTLDSEIILITPEIVDAKGKAAMLPLKIPAGLIAPLVILLPDPSSATGLRAFAVEDSADSFKFGSTRFFNTTGKALAVRYEKNVIQLSKSWVATDVTPGGGSRNLGVQVASGDSAPKVLYSAIWEYDPQVRKIALIVAGSAADPGLFEVKIISENRRELVAL